MWTWSRGHWEGVKETAENVLNSGGGVGLHDPVGDPVGPFHCMNSAPLQGHLLWAAFGVPNAPGGGREGEGVPGPWPVLLAQPVRWFLCLPLGLENWVGRPGRHLESQQWGEGGKGLQEGPVRGRNPPDPPQLLSLPPPPHTHLLFSWAGGNRPPPQAPQLPSTGSGPSSDAPLPGKGWPSSQHQPGTAGPT